MIYSLRNKKSVSGFTLIELLVVIAIIGILATVVLASLNNARRKSRDARRVTDIKQVQLALELYFDGVGNNSYPTGTATCTPSPGALAADDNYNLQPLVTSGYIAVLPRDPVTRDCYFYRTKVAPSTVYHLATVLEDTTNVALGSDKDCDDGVAGSCASGAVFTDGAARIRGALATCTAAGAENCYDVTP